MLVKENFVVLGTRYHGRSRYFVQVEKFPYSPREKVQHGLALVWLQSRKRDSFSYLVDGGSFSGLEESVMVQYSFENRRLSYTNHKKSFLIVSGGLRKVISAFEPFNSFDFDRCCVKKTRMTETIPSDHPFEHRSANVSTLVTFPSFILVGESIKRCMRHLFDWIILCKNDGFSLLHPYILIILCGIRSIANPLSFFGVCSSRNFVSARFEW